MAKRIPRTRIAGAPISWGVSEVPGWGHQLSPHRVLEEMRSLGLVATEFGPPGFPEADVNERVDQLASYGLAAVGGFHVAVLHEPGHDPLPGMDGVIDECVMANADVVVLAAGSGQDGYSSPSPRLDDPGWKTLLANLSSVAEHAARRGVTACLHPHIGTMVESDSDTRRVLDGSTIGLCIDTGHLAAAGADPLAIAAASPDRVAHVHLKDVERTLATQFLAGSLNFAEAVRAGMFVPLGTGSVNLHGLIALLEASGYRGWYVLEQDTALSREPDLDGPLANVRKCLSFLDGS